MRRGIIATGLYLSIIGSCFAQISTALTVRTETRIQPQALGSALQQFAKVDHIQVLYLTANVAHLRTSGAVGRLTTDETLALLLAGTGLKYRYVASNVVSIISPCCRKDTTVNTPNSEAAPHSVITSPGGHTIHSGKTNVTDAGGQLSEPNDPPLTVNTDFKSNNTADTLTEVIVTAQKYRQRAFDVPISLQVIDGATLLQHGITNLVNLQYDVPGIYVDDTGFTHSVYLRGVANSLGNGSMVGTYIDEADLTTEAYVGGVGYDTGDSGLYDLNRVEVLKGPQGTLYGDGSMGGVIRYITNRPELNRVEMSADVATLFTEDGAPSQRIETMINAPFVTDTLGFRFAGIIEHDGGWVDEPAANLRNINDSNLVDVRAEALWQPTEQLQVNAMEIIHRHAYGLGAGEDSSGNITPPFESTLTPNIEDNSNLSNLTVTCDFPVARLMSSTTYFDETEALHNQFGVEPPIDGTTYGWITPYQSNDDQDLSEELRLVHAGTGPWQWTVGGFYKRFSDSGLFGGQYLGAEPSLLASVPFYPGYSYGDTSKSWAGFASTSVTLFERLTIGAGARYFKIRDTTISTPPPPPFEAASFTSTDPRFYVQYRVSSHVNTYVSASKGFRSGGFNAPPAAPYQPEVLWSYELGSKIRYPAEGLRGDADIFYMNYTNFVTTALIPTAPFYVETNAGAARIKGVDADLTWQPVDRWRLSVNTEILNTAFLTATSISPYSVGDRLPFAPRYSFTGSVAREFRWLGKPGDLEIYYYEIGRVQYRTPLSQSDVLHLLNARTALHWTDNLTLEFFAQNILNERGQESPYYPYDESARPRPRTFGIEFNVRL